MQEPLPLLDTPGLTISFDAANHWLYVEWKGEHSATTAQTGGLEVIRCLGQYPCRKLLNDNSQVTSNWERGARWVGEHYYPELARLGVAYVAWVYPAHWAVRKSMDTAMRFVTAPLVVTFDELATAYAWLQQVS